MQDIIGSIDWDSVYTIVRALLLVAAGIALARGVRGFVESRGEAHVDAHVRAISARIAGYAIGVLFSIAALRELGFDLGVLLGAAGVLTVAVGFASQTSAANVISGLFLVGERPFGVGDVVRIGGTTGEVVSMGLLSVRLRTFDNLMVRLPNETLIKSEITNLSAFAIRRIDLALSVAYKEDLARVSEILLEIADENPLCLEEPVPLVIHGGFGDSGIALQFSVWVDRTRFLEVRNGLYLEIQQRFAAEAIEIPFPHVSLYRGAASEPFRIELVPAPSPAPRDTGSPAPPSSDPSE